MAVKIQVSLLVCDTLMMGAGWTSEIDILPQHYMASWPRRPQLVCSIL